MFGTSVIGQHLRVGQKEGRHPTVSVWLGENNWDMQPGQVVLGGLNSKGAAQVLIVVEL